MLSRGEEVIVGKVIVELPLDDALHNFTEDWDDRNGSKVGWNGWNGRITGFVDGMDDRVFSLVGELRVG